MRLSLIFALTKKKTKTAILLVKNPLWISQNVIYMMLLDVRTLERALQCYLDCMHFYVLYLFFLSHTQFAQSHKAVVWSYTQVPSREWILPGLVTSELSSRVNYSSFLRLKWRICIDYLVSALFFVIIMWAAQHSVKVCLVFQLKASILYLVTSKFSLKSMKPEGKHSELDSRPWFRLYDT